MVDTEEQTEARLLKDDIEKVIKALDEHHKNVNIARVAGSTLSAATGAATVLAVMAVCTAGVSMIPAAALGLMSSAGAAVSLGASAAEHFVKKHNVKETQKKWKFFQQAFRTRHPEFTVGQDEKLRGLKARTSGSGAKGDNQNNRPGLAAHTEDALRILTISGKAANSSAAGAIKAAARGIRVVHPLLAVASAIAIPMDILDLVQAGVGLYKGEPSTAKESLQQIVAFLHLVESDQLETALQSLESLDRAG